MHLKRTANRLITANSGTSLWGWAYTYDAMGYGWVDGPMSCSCKEPDCWDKLKDWAKQWTNPDPRPLPPMLPLPPFEPARPLEPLPPPVWEPAPATPILPIFNLCILNPSLCFGQSGPA